MMIRIFAICMNAFMKVAIGWLTYTFANFLEFPEWGVITLMIMAVTSTHFKVRE